MAEISTGSGAAQSLVEADLRLALCVALAVAIARLLPVLVSALVLGWHALRGSAPGPAGQQLLSLVHMLWSRGRP